MEPEICTVTGGEAYASFKDGFGHAWYGSDHDTSLMVDLSGTFDGPVCDEVITKAIERGDVVVYGSHMSGLRKPSEVGVAAATELFLRGAADQAKALAGPKAASMGAITTRRGSVTAINRADPRLPLAAPDWQAPVWDVTGGGSRQEVSRDFDRLGGLWALSRAAKGLPSDDYGDARAAAEDSFRFAVEVEEAEARAAEIDVALSDAFEDAKADQSFEILLRMPADGTREEYDARFAALVECLGEAGCLDATVSTSSGEGLVNIDFTRKGFGIADAVSSAITSVLSAIHDLGPGYRIERVEFREEA